MSDLHLVRGHVDAGAAQGGGWQEGRAKEENMPADHFFETSMLVLATTFPLVVRCWFFATYLPVGILTDFEAWMSDLCQGRTYYHNNISCSASLVRETWNAQVDSKYTTRRFCMRNRLCSMSVLTRSVWCSATSCGGPSVSARQVSRALPRRPSARGMIKEHRATQSQLHH